MRLVLDTNVLVAAMRSPRGASAGIVLRALEGAVEIVANVGLFVEYEAVMTRPEHLNAAQVSREEILSVLDDLANAIKPVERDVSWRPQLPDADDEVVLEAAINGQAEIVVTFETATFKEAAQRFGIAVMTPGEIWGILPK